MTTVTDRPVTPITTASAGAALAGAGEHTSLVVEPRVSAGSVESLYALMSAMSGEQEKSGKADVERRFEEKHAAILKYREQLAEAAEAQKSSGVFDVVAVVAVVASAAVATVATGGAGAPVAVGVGLALSAGGFAVSETKCLDPVLGEGASQWVGAGMTLCGTAVTLLGPGAAGTLVTVAKGLQSGATAAKGAQQIENSIRGYVADGHAQDAAQTQMIMRRLERAIEEVIERMSETKDTTRRGTEHLNGIVETDAQTQLLAAGGRA